jgi:hypothetical protein
MTVTLVRPARLELSGFGAATLVRVRPAPALDPPYDDEPEPPLVEPYLSRPGTPGGHDPAPPGPAVSAAASRVVRRYLELCLEVLGGYRPLAHLRPHTELARFDEVATQLARLGGPGRSALVRPGSGPARVPADRPRLRHLRMCEVRPGAVEAAAVLGRGEQIRAMTLRLEQRDTGWLCTHLEVL